VPSRTSSVSRVRLPPRDKEFVLIVTDEFVSLLFAIYPASIVFVTEPVSPVVTTVPLRFGKVIVLSAVG